MDATSSFVVTNRIGIVGKIGNESGMHKLIREVRGRVFYQRHVVAKLHCKANR